MTDKRSSPVKAIIGPDKVVGLMTEDGLNVPGFDGTGYVTDEELEEELGSLPIQKGAGHDSAVLKATPNPEDPSVDRTNTVTGAFSAILAGSRNNISASESAAAGGIINIEGGGNNFGTGYRQTMTDCENSMSNGYRNTLNTCKQTYVAGRNIQATNFVNGIITGNNIDASGQSSSDPIEGNCLFGYGILSTISYGLGSGAYNVLSHKISSVIGEHLITSKRAQTNVGAWNKANDQAYFVVGAGQGEDARKNSFAAGWDDDAGDEAARKVTWFGDTRFSEKTLHQLMVGSSVSFLPRIDKDDSWWETNSTIGRVDQWGGTDADNVEKKGKIFAIYGNSNSSEHTSHVVFIISTGAVSESNRNCNGEVILHVSGDAASRIMSSYI